MLRYLVCGTALGFGPMLLAKDREVTIGNEREHLISPYIYGFGTYLKEDRKEEKVWDMRPTLYRWGGNTSTRYNYKINAWNTAADWFFTNYSAPEPNIIDSFMKENIKNGAASMITLPMLGWVAKDGTSASFPRSIFAKQDAFDNDSGNGMYNGENLPSDPNRTSVAIGPDFVEGWVTKLKDQFGTHPHFYIMDNEAMLWNSTHRDIQPTPMSYDSYLKKYLSFAKVVRKADPRAVIVGPALWGWMDMHYSAFDAAGPWNNEQRGGDRKNHGDKPFLEWFLEQVALEEKKEKVSLLDIIDVHNYPETGEWPGNGDSSPEYRKALLESTRSLWDRNFTDKSWINEKMYLIPRLQEIARKFKPTAKVSIGEYNYRSEDDPSGGIAQAEILGIFAKENLYAAQYWDYPSKDKNHRLAFLLYRNFDGKGAQFASNWVGNDLGITDDASVFTAADSKRLTIVVLNKSLKENQGFDFKLKDWPAIAGARMISYKPDGKTFNVSETKLDTSRGLRVDTVPLSMQMIEVNFR